jgi:hypothetical protein
VSEVVNVSEVRLTVYGLPDDFGYLNHQQKRDHLVGRLEPLAEEGWQRTVVDWLKDPATDVYFFKPTTAPIGQVEIRPRLG